MTIGHCIVALMFATAGGLCFVAGCMALYRRGRYWGMIWAMASVGVISSATFVILKFDDLVNGREYENWFPWMLHDFIQSSFMLVCAMASLIYMINWRGSRAGD